MVPFLIAGHNLLPIVSTIRRKKTKLACPLWYVEQMGECSCVNTLNKHIECSRDSLIVKKNTVCLTWDDQTDFVHASYCLFIPIDYALCKFQIH